VRAAVNQCRDQYTTLQRWVAADNAYNRYQAEVVQAKRHKPPVSIARLGPAPPEPGPQPPSVGATCPSSQQFGIPASALAPAGPGPS